MASYYTVSPFFLTLYRPYPCKLKFSINIHTVRRCTTQSGRGRREGERERERGRERERERDRQTDRQRDGERRRERERERESRRKAAPESCR